MEIICNFSIYRVVCLNALNPNLLVLQFGKKFMERLFDFGCEEENVLLEDQVAFLFRARKFSMN